MASTLTLPHWLQRRKTLFACFHGPSSDSRPLGVLICNSFGHEMLSTHRALRHLAQQLAEAGFSTLRFDYHGTGDSSGSDEDPGRGVSWLESIEEGVRALEYRGARGVALVGVRFGALLALEYARTRPVDTLILIGTPAGGKSYLRELRAMQSLKFGSAAPPDGGTTASEEELVGFLLRKDAAEFLTNLPPPGPVAPARRVLIVPRDDLPGQDLRLAERLSVLGSRVTLSNTKGYAGMVVADPVKVTVPEPLWNEIVGWLDAEPSDGRPPVSGRGYSRKATVRLSDVEPELTEEILDVGGMFGILSRPTKPIANAPLIVLPNIGANYHIGCNRIYVELGRRWAALGFSVMRFDVTGIGDSPALAGQRENDIYADSSIADTGRVLRWGSEVLGVERFVLGGVCSGAYASYYAALANTSVSAVLLMNPLTFQWLEGDSLEARGRTTLKSTDFYARAALDPGTWRRLVRHNVNVQAIAQVMAQRAWRRLRRLRASGPGTDIAVGFRRLCARGSRVILVCGEDDGSRDVVSEHLGPNADELAGESNFRFEIIRGTDHTFAPRAARHDLYRVLTAHLLGTYGTSREQPPLDLFGVAAR